MTDHDLLLEPAKVLILDNPTDRVQLPPPPAKVDEAAAMWKPADQPEQMERIPLSSEKDEGAALAMAIMLGGPAIQLIMPEKPELTDEDEPGLDDEKPRKS